MKRKRLYINIEHEDLQITKQNYVKEKGGFIMTTPITTVCGNFYAGMTRAEAEAKDLTERPWYRSDKGLFAQSTFDEIDLNKDGVLQDTEICARRDEETDNKKDSKQGLLLGGGLCGLLALIPGVNVAVGVGAALVGAASTISSFVMGDGTEEKRATEAYKQEHVYKR